MYTDKMEIHIVELPKLKKYQYPETELLRWARFFNAENKEEMQMAVQGDKYMEKAYNRLVNLSADDEKRLEYEERQKAIRDYNHMINSGWRTGHARGYAEGHAEGHAEGRIQECIEILQEMGISEEKIQDKLAQKFSLSEKEIEEFMEKYWKRAES